MAEPVCASTIYEVIPRDKLPLLNLSRSVGGELLAFLRFLARCSISYGRVATAAESRQIGGIERLLQDADAQLEKRWLYGVSLVSFCIGCGLGAVACVVPQAVGVFCAVVGLALTLPLSFLSVAFLRFDMLMLVLSTYDFWFYSLVNTIGAVLLATSFADPRACVAAIVWLGNGHSIVIDANTRFICYLTPVSVAVVVLNLVLVVAIETRSIEVWQPQTLRLRAHHNDYVATNNLISNALTTMTIIVMRNAYRRHTELLQQYKINCPMLRCINYRCRVRVVAADAKRLADLKGPMQKTYYAPDCSQIFPRSQMHYVRFQLLMDASHTIVPVQHPLRQWSAVKRAAFVGVGSTSLILTVAVFGLYPSPHVRLCAILGLVLTIAFVAFTLGLFHRVASRSIVLSFDYLFVSLQLSSGLWCTAMLFDWDARCIALASMWLWLHWVLTIDGLSTEMKHKIGVNVKLLVEPVMLLFVAAQLCAAVEIAWWNQWDLQDRVVVSFANRVDLRLLPFFVSRLIMTFLWSLRLLWRIATSRDGDALIQLGRVAYRYKTEIPIRARTLKDTAEAQKKPPEKTQSGGGASARVPTAQVAPSTQAF